jgi:hypothetical protein
LGYIKMTKRKIFASLVDLGHVPAN